MSQSDFQLALLLQQQFEHEASIDNPVNNLYYSKKPPPKDKSLVDPSWELIDPTPNIHNLFVAFNEKYFWNKLQMVCVEWSKRMTSCAGVCYYSGRGGLCRISLSEPLLKLRPRKDLIQTLLHEMIHALLFVTANNRDRDGHGPEFHKHMHRINTEAGTNISVYHDFIDEVRLYQQHWWRCNGPCQHQKPYFGMVRRATNRAPGPNDRWWDTHSKTCGGSFIKVKEPEKSTTKKTTKEESRNTINKYFPILKEKINNVDNYYKSTNSSNVVGLNNLSRTSTATHTNSNGTIVITKKPVQSIPKTSTISKPIPVTTVISATTRDKSKSDYEEVRNHWINKYPNNNVQIKRDKPADDTEPKDVLVKRPRPNNSNLVKCPICQNELQLEDINLHLDKCIEQPLRLQDNSKNGDTEGLIACLVCDKIVLKADLSKHLDDCMGDDIFICNDNADNAENETDVTADEMEKRYNCPVCSQKFYVSDMSDHLNICLINDNVFDEPF